MFKSCDLERESLIIVKNRCLPLTTNFHGKPIMCTQKDNEKCGQGPNRNSLQCKDYLKVNKVN